MSNKLENIITDIIYSPDYTPQEPFVLLENIKLSYEEYSDLDESVFWRAISRLEKSFEIAFTKKGKLANPSEMGIYRGVFSSSSRGSFGFVTTDDGREFFIPPKFTAGAVYSDTVAIKRLDFSSKAYGKGNEAEVISIIERGLSVVIGTLVCYQNGRHQVCEVEPDNDRIRIRITVPQKSLNGAKNQDKVACKITAFPRSEFDTTMGEIVACLGRSDTLEANYKGILHENGILTEFKEQTLKNAEEVSKEAICPSGRVDLRDKTIFTIDSSEAKDLDDAISIEETENGFILGVHIADVSHYVKANSPLDKEAFERGTSVYFVDKVVPMLPKELSNFICSLNEGEDRYALSAFIEIDRVGNILSTEIKNTIIRSKIKGIYAELNDIIELGEDSEFYEKYAHVLDDFKKMLSLYEILKAKSLRKGAMELESDEAKIVLDEDGLPIDVIKRERGESERLIEQFMLSANEGVATFLYNASIPCIYRVHDEPDREKINSFAIFAKNLGVDISPLRAKNTITPSQLSLILKDAEEKGHSSIVSNILLRSLMKARYSSVQKAHFGLNTKYYCHFTSPIRRYPDLCVHRILKAFLSGEITESNIEKYDRFASVSAEMSSECEVRAVHAEREIEDLYKCVYMRKLIGEELDVVISSVGAFGFFAKTDNLCEGLVSMESLGGGFTYDRENHLLARGKTVYSLGRRVKVLVSDVDVALRQVSFTLISKESSPFKEKEARASKEGSKPHKRSNRSKASYNKRRKR